MLNNQISNDEFEKKKFNRGLLCWKVTMKK